MAHAESPSFVRNTGRISSTDQNGGLYDPNIIRGRSVTPFSEVLCVARRA